MDASPEIERLLNRTMRFKHSMLLLNGNMKTPIRMNKKRYLLSNTCAFNSVTILITMAIIDSELYKQFSTKNGNKFLTFCNELAKHGISVIIYKQRLEMLKNIFKQDIGMTDVTSINLYIIFY